MFIDKKKEIILNQIKVEQKTKEIKEKQEDADDDLSWFSTLKPSSVSDTNGTSDPACKAGLGQIGNIYLNIRYLLKACKDSGLEESDKTGKNNINF